MEKSYQDMLEFFMEEPSEDKEMVAARACLQIARTTSMHYALLHCLVHMHDKLLIRKACKAGLEQGQKDEPLYPQGIEGESLQRSVHGFVSLLKDT